MKVSELTDEQLNYWCAKAQGWADNSYGEWWIPDGDFQALIKDYDPINNWQQAGELVEKYKVDLAYDAPQWYAECSDQGWDYADTPQRAICLAVVASVYGDEVSDE